MDYEEPKAACGQKKAERERERGSASARARGKEEPHEPRDDDEKKSFRKQRE